MGLHTIRRGLDLPIAGTPRQEVAPGPPVGRVAVLADDFPGLAPRLLVAEGDRVRRGQAILEDRSTPGVRHTAPGAGRVAAIHRGPRRALRSVVIELSDGEREGRPPDDAWAPFASHRGGDPERLDGAAVAELLAESGAWTGFRTRPFGRVPRPGTRPAAIFVTAIDTNPLAADPDVVLADQIEPFDLGLRAVARLTDGPTYLCVSADSTLPGRVAAPVSVERFRGPHPAGTAGVHVHLLAPVSRTRTVWTVGYQDVASIGRLLATGRADVRRIVSVAGPPVADPRLVETRAGAGLADLTAGAATGSAGEIRWISGSVLSGKAAVGEAFGYLGRYDTQVSALAEGRRREFLGWLLPGRDKYSAIPVVLPRLRRPRDLPLTTSTHGARRAMVPIGLYERVMPMDILPTFLLRALVVGDTERAEELGCLELVEEDVALCTFVDPGKADYAPFLRATLDAIAKDEG